MSKKNKRHKKSPEQKSTSALHSQIAAFMQQPVDLTDNGQCSRCGGCCSSVMPVTEKELAAMKAYADKLGYVPELPGDVKDDLVYAQCPFLKLKTAPEIKRTCMVYDVRPDICKAFICCQTNGATARAYQDMNNGMPPPKCVNLWKAYNRTGLRKDSEEIPYDDAPVVALEDDEGRHIVVQVGQPVNITTADNRYFHAALCIGLFEETMQIAANGRIMNIAYDAIKSITT